VSSLPEIEVKNAGSFSASWAIGDCNFLLVPPVKDSGFSPNPYAFHFLFFSIYSSYFSFMQAFEVSQSLL